MSLKVGDYYRSGTSTYRIEKIYTEYTGDDYVKIKWLEEDYIDTFSQNVILDSIVDGEDIKLSKLEIALLEMHSSEK